MNKMDRRDFIKISALAFGGFALAGKAGNTLSSMAKKMEALSPASALDPKEYRQIVKSTSEFCPKGKTQDAVRLFLEKGGMYRTEHRPVSEKKYASVLYFDKPVDLVAGTNNRTDGTAQKTVNGTERIEPGIYIFNYDTEAGLTIRQLGSDAEVLKAALNPKDEYGFLAARSVKINVTAHEGNLLAVAGAIWNAVELYKKNPQMAAIMEMAVDAVYAKGNAGLAVPFGESFQSANGKMAVKEAVRRIMADMEESVVREMSSGIAEMTVSTPRVFANAFNADKPNMDMARRELLLANETVDSLVVSFGVAGGRLELVVYSGTGFYPGSASHNPVMAYRISGKDGPTEFSNVYAGQWRGMIDGYDFDNAGHPEEDAHEKRLTGMYQRVTGTNGSWTAANEVKLLNVDIGASFAKIQNGILDGFAKAARQ